MTGYENIKRYILIVLFIVGLIFLHFVRVEGGGGGGGGVDKIERYTGCLCVTLSVFTPGKLKNLPDHGGRFLTPQAHSTPEYITP